MRMIDQRRLKVWQALSELFLDTELDDRTFAYIAQAVVDSGFSPEEIHTILWGEVFPVLEANLRSVAGEWAGWTDDWLVDHLSLYEGPMPARGVGPVAEEISRCWKQVTARLAPAFADL